MLFSRSQVSKAAASKGGTFPDATLIDPFR